ncbi:MAG: exodeoxyribonuclease VII large subunit [Firmicutes bacterium]|nr:exodeoxyribonuclease VII large subunit [Bacillota bacterium]
MIAGDWQRAGVLTVSDVTARVAEAVRAHHGLSGVWVVGEISNFTHHTSGHMYFTLKDDFSRLRAVMFRGQNTRLRFMPANGMSVFAHGSVEVYERGGEYQLYTDTLEPLGMGALYLAFQELRARLEAEGLFDAELKRPLPTFPSRIAVVTSPTGAAIRDIITVARRRFPGINILVVPALVQGEGAPDSIARGIELASRVEDVDCLIVGRGGGSAEELWVFNDEKVARAIRASRVPVVSAVGHETDFTIADFAADVRAPTPSAAAEMVVPDVAALTRRVENARARLVRAGALAVDHRRQAVDENARWLGQKIQTRLQMSREKLARLAGVLAALDPESVLARGYAICRAADGRAIRSADEAAPGEQVSVELSRGSLECEVREIRTGG